MAFRILVVDSSPRGEQSLSRKLTADVVRQLRARHPDSTVVTRDLSAAPLPHLDAAALNAFFTPPEQRNAALAAAIGPSDRAIDELLAADVIVIGAPMWNFGIPSSLKAWIDHVVRAGRTFKYGAAGPESLVPEGKKVIVVSARGGVYSEGPMKAMDHQEAYLKAVLGFIGLHDVVFVRAEGVALGEDTARAAVQAAQGQVAETIKEIA